MLFAQCYNLVNNRFFCFQILSDSSLPELPSEEGQGEVTVAKSDVIVPCTRHILTASKESS